MLRFHLHHLYLHSHLHPRLRFSMLHYHFRPRLLSSILQSRLHLYRLNPLMLHSRLRMRL
jgi:hypothetical protein